MPCLQSQIIKKKKKKKIIKHKLKQQKHYIAVILKSLYLTNPSSQLIELGSINTFIN